LRGCHDRRAAALSRERLPGVTFLIPAYNEEKHLAQKIANLQEIDYPSDKLQVIFVSDGSTDRTNDILSTLLPREAEVIFLPCRSGKATALNTGVAQARHNILVFSDCSTLFAPDAVRKLVRQFSDPSVGAVCGALRFQASSESQQTEGVYWRYETMLRLMEGRVGATLTASGAIYALRRDAYLPLPSSSILDDLLIPMNARKLGFQVLYDPEVIGTDFAPEGVRGEFTRRVRLAVGSFQALPYMLRLPMGRLTKFAFLSHKVLRWILPLSLCALLVSNTFLLKDSFYAVFGAVQVAFFLWACMGCLLRPYLLRVRFGLLGYFVLAMNVAFLVGLLRCLTNRGEALWHRVN
jgi:cellulose synthase/poly-beta-1,6-N-acetylglucosamine synthase-like glycosyltransferase